ncbi:KpsF/GutQ family protein [Thermodesulfatator indicus DSM 15286]|uniref:KpsF/GutQ family protein n=1 Tax=Thermodesulfatator indicus (strain DSM 15286 / JCM 11887 / CIR29812) TaxID=667014 RepID=F8A918_THEID|nr:KpsF/GutQ family sugar-phosphate isomerase [Thermodesulfatator indicus]AEH45146.1 KpsF/GutQ family protein [Thermodesulfatator indicus DSM 15286]
MKPEFIVKNAQEVFDIEIEGLKEVQQKLGPEFVKAVELILNTRGRVVVTGIGKSGLIGRKIVATLSSTGTPSFFLHPAEALHGDLGMVVVDDILLAISNSGETEEVNKLLPSLKNRGVKIIAFTGNPSSTLAKNADVVIDIGVPREACPLGVAPTASTTATLVMGDALAMVLAKLRNIRLEDFRRNHPGGSLGERLKVAVSQIMLTGEALPLVAPEDTMSQVIEVMDEKRLGCALVVEEGKRLCGIVTDGDLRRALLKYGDFRNLAVKKVMTPNPKTIEPEALAAEALYLMEKKLITVLPVTDEEKRVVGILHLHDILGKGQFKFN